MGGTGPEIIAICRFSYLATRGWKKTVAGDLEATERALFDDARMAAHLDFFRTLCLPSVLGQSAPGMRLLILASPRMPARWRGELERLVGPHDAVDLHYLRPRPMVAAVSLALRRARGDRAEPFVQVILDDDDALAGDYAERLSALAGAALGAGFGRDRPLAFSFPRGITLPASGGEGRAQLTLAPFLAQGLALLTDGAAERNVFSVPHLKTPLRHRVWSDPEPVAYLRGMHGHHDSRGVAKGRQRDLDQDEFDALLAAHFPALDRREVARLAGLDGAVSPASGPAAG